MNATWTFAVISAVRVQERKEGFHLIKNSVHFNFANPTPKPPAPEKLARQYMLKILGRERKTTATSMADGSTSSELFHEYDVVVDDLSEAWEFINASSSDDDEETLDNFSFTEEEEDAVTDEVSSGPNKGEGPLPEFGSPSSDISMESLAAQLLHHHSPPVADVHLNGDENNNEVDDYDDDEYDEYDDGYDLDDELVPWGLSDKFGRQRIRKLGKRAGPRMNKAKRLAYRYNRPGCVHGKHGFGVQHSYI